MERFDPKEENKYRKIYGAIAWPGKRPGFAVIIGQKNEIRLNGHDLVMLDEIEDSDIRSLVHACNGLDYFYRPDTWIGDRNNAAADSFIRELNREQRPMKPLRIRSSAMFDMKNAYSYFFPMLKEILIPERRRLFLKPDSKLIAYMYQPQPSDIPTLEFGDYPAIEALALAVLELEKSTNNKPLATKCVYDPLKF